MRVEEKYRGRWVPTELPNMLPSKMSSTLRVDFSIEGAVALARREMEEMMAVLSNK